MRVNRDPSNCAILRCYFYPQAIHDDLQRLRDPQVLGTKGTVNGSSLLPVVV